jgi:hypothetical protein
MNITEQDIKVSSLLKEWGIKYQVNYLGFSKTDDWPSDRWSISFNQESFDYKTGIGHRIKAKYPNSGLFKSDIVRELKKLRECLDAPKNQSTVYKAEDWKHTRESVNKYAVTPTQASVLYCLLMDMDSGDMTFSEFCQELGYQSDSIKDRDIYLACQETKEQMNRLFNQNQLAELQEALEDY